MLFTRPMDALRFRVVDGLSIRFIESDPRAIDALLLSPWPESVLAYEPIWSRLADRAHLIAIDLPGFGRSEGQDALMSPRAMGEFVVRVADAFGLERPHVVAPDVGTSAMLFAAAGHPARFRSLVVGSGASAFPIQLDGPLREWVFATDLEPFRKLGGRPIVERAMQTLERYKPTSRAQDDYIASYDGDRFAESMRYVRSFPRELEALSNVLRNVEAPVQIIAGLRDRVVPVINAEYLHQRLRYSELKLLDTTHFAWEDAADDYATLVETWWERGFKHACANDEDRSAKPRIQMTAPESVA